MDDRTTSSMDDISMVEQVANKRFELSDGLSTIITELETTRKGATSDEIKNSMVLGFDGNRCQKGSQLHSNGFASCCVLILIFIYLIQFNYLIKDITSSVLVINEGSAFLL